MSDLAAALANLQNDLPYVPKDTKAQYGNYADLATLTRIVMPRLADLGLVWVCYTERDGDKVDFHYRLYHIANPDEWIGGVWPIPVSTPQTMVGAVTYARRCCLCMVTGVAPDDEDDDGQAAELEARALSRRPPEVDQDGAATFAEQERMLHDQAGWQHATPDPSARTEWDAPAASKPDPMRAAMGAMFALYKELGISEKEPMLFDIGEILDKPVTSRADLSLEEVKAVNGVLRKRRDAARKAGSVTHA